MSNVKDALLRMFRSAKTAKEYADKLHPYETPYDDIYGEIADAIYDLVGEKTENFQDSLTYTVLHAPILEERAASMLYYKYRQIQAGMPAPNTFTQEEMKAMHEKNGGYITPEGEWK